MKATIHAQPKLSPGFCYSVRKWIGALAAALEGHRCTGIHRRHRGTFPCAFGSASATISIGWVSRWTWAPMLHGEQCISAPTSKVLVFALATDEEQVMAEITASLLGTQ